LNSIKLAVKNTPEGVLFSLMRAHPGAHCFVLIRFLFLMKSPHSTIFEAEPREAYQLMLTISKNLQTVKNIVAKNGKNQSEKE
jgi:hypothetical protein